MAQPPSIRFDEVLELLRGPVVGEFEAEQAARLGHGLSEGWGDSQRTTRELASTGITRAELEALFTEDRPMLLALCGAIIDSPDDGEEWPRGEEHDEDDKPVTVGQQPRLGRGFSMHHACCLWLLRNRGDAELVAWAKLRRIPSHRKFAKELRAAYERLMKA